MKLLLETLAGLAVTLAWILVAMHLAAATLPTACWGSKATPRVNSASRPVSDARREDHNPVSRQPGDKTCELNQ